MEKELEYDLVVVGAGPAGSSAAYMAAKNGVKVALIEKEESVAHSVRTSGVTWLDTIEEFGIPDDCYNPIKNYSFCSPNNKVTISDKVSRSAVLDVRKTYRWLSSQAEKQGVDIFLKTNVIDVIKDNQEMIIGVKAGSSDEEFNFHCKVVIDASGFQSVVAKAMGLVTQWERFGAGAEWEVKAEHADSQTWWLMVGQEYSPAGYAWIFPLGNNIVRIGVGVGKPESTIDPTQRLKE
ncbi:MAG: NAD(P)/FAD-dependent oxidoreductase, partial [Nitrosopumilaceae archaeon]